MRKIKFRAFYEGEWYYQTLEEILTITLAAFRLGLHKTQFTGLRDKNGKEIYEGDIVKWDDGSKGEYWRFAQVKINPDMCFDCNGVKGDGKFENSGGDYCFRYGNFLYTDTKKHLIVIGNLYETPELLNP